MKRIFLAILLSGFFVSHLMAQDITRGAGDHQLVVLMTDGSKLYFSLSERPKITFVEQDMRICSASKTQDLFVSNVARFYTSKSTDSVHDLKSNDKRIIYNSDEKIVIEGISAEGDIRLYALDGREVTNQVSYSGENAIVSLASLRSGTYILTIGNGQSLKIFKR